MKVLSYNLWNSLNENVEDLKLTKYSNENQVKIGDRIYHKNYGLGTIMGFENDEIKIVKIKFDNKKEDFYLFILKMLLDKKTIKKVEKEFDDIDFSNNNKITQKNKEIEEEEIEEEEIEEEYDDYITIEELYTIKISDFFEKEELEFLVSLKEIKEYKTKLKNSIETKFNSLKNKIIKRRLETTNIIEEYFKYLMKLFPNTNIYKFNGKIPYSELWDIRKKERLKLSNDILDKYNGVFFYWVFSDGIVFKIL